MKLRSYQWDAVVSVLEYFQENTGHPVVVMPTGTGKSLVIAALLRYVVETYPGQRVMALTHVKELIEQNHKKLLDIWPLAPAGINSAGLGRDDTLNSIIFGGIATVAKKAHLFGKIDLILIDECHLVSPTQTTMYRSFIQHLMDVNPNLKVIGLTATPYRMKQGRVIEEGGLFTDICYDLSSFENFNNLVDEGYLSPLVTKRTKFEYDTDGVKKSGGEFVQRELQKTVDREELTEKAISEAMEHGDERKSWLVFTAGVEHAENTADILNIKGIPAIAVHGKLTSKQREEAITAYKRGEYMALVNNNILTTGFDHPNIDLILILRPTRSPGLWVQMLGRGTRPVFADGFDLTTPEGRHEAMRNGPKQDCLVLDFSGNTRRLGPINDPVVPNPRKKGKGTAPVRCCDQCNNWIHASLTECPHCGKEYKHETAFHVEASTADILRDNAPVVELFKVDHITYSLHTKADRPPMMAVVYYCGLAMFKEYVCFEHGGFAERKARRWWKDRSKESFPQSTQGAINSTDKLSVCTSLRVWTNKKYPEIMAYCFDGTHFGTEEPEFNVSVGTDQPKEKEPMEDDIPF